MSWLTIFIKEIKDNLRDRRAVTSSLVFGPLFGPLIFAVMISTVTKQELEDASVELEVPVAGIETTPNLATFLSTVKINLKPTTDNLESLVKDKHYDVALRIPADFEQQWQAGKPAEIEVILDKSRRDANQNQQRVIRALNSYGQRTAMGRLQLRGINPAITQPIAVRQVDISTPTSRGALILGMLPFFLLMTVFVGGMYLAIDTTAGEKERGSLEPLLINPVPRWQIMLGKLASTFCFCLLTLVVALVAFAISVDFIPTESLGLSVNLTPEVLTSCFILIVPVALIASAIQTIIASFSKGFREAQTYLSFLQLIPMVPALWLMISPVKQELWMATVPILSQTILINELVKGEPLQSVWLATSMGCSLLFGLLCSAVAAHLYNRPALIFKT